MTIEKKLTNTGGLYIMFCPYCGTPKPEVRQRAEGHMLESVKIYCSVCDELTVIDRQLDDDDDDGEEI